MRPNAGQAASARPDARLVAAALALLLTLFSGLPARAGDKAQLDIIGYSQDGRYFAFEEYGVQDGSGFAYASIYVIDLVADKWTYGTPFGAQAGEANPDEPLEAIRAEARSHAEEKLQPHHIDVPAETLALIGDGEVGGDGRSLSFALPACCGPGAVSEAVSTLRLDTFPIAAPEAYCGDMKPVGYGLSLETASGTRSVHRDGKRLPFTRGCTLDYRLYAVVRPFAGKGPPVAVIATYPFGFEGPDRRFIAIALEKP